MQKIGVIVAGGKSSRMGRDKAKLAYNGYSFLDHARRLLTEFGADEIHVLGKHNEIDGAKDPLPDAGPAANLHAWINDQNLPAKFIVLPVDMPLVTLKHLQALDNAGSPGAYFNDLYLPILATIDNNIGGNPVRMKDLVAALNLKAVPANTKWLCKLKNINTTEDFAALPS